MLKHLPKVDIAARGKECVLLLTELQPELVAWYPEDQVVGVVSNTLLPPGFIPSASSSSLLCGFHMEDILAEWSGNGDAWEFRVAVCNPTTGFQLKLPLLEIPMDDSLPWMKLSWGEVQLQVKGDQELFSVYVLYQVPKTTACTVFTFNSSSRSWNSSSSTAPLTGCLTGEFVFGRDKLVAYDPSTNTWTATPFPGGVRAWNDYPMPEECVGGGYTYWKPLTYFRHRGKVMAYGECRLPVKERSLASGDAKESVMVVLELDADSNACKLVSSLDTRQFRPASGDLPMDVFGYYLEGALVLGAGDLLVHPTTNLVAYPLAFDLKDQRWLEPPVCLRRCAVQPVCIYNP